MPSNFWYRFFWAVLGAIALPLAQFEGAGASMAPMLEELPADAYRPDRILIIPKHGHEVQLGELHRRLRIKVRRAFPRTGGIQVLELPAGVGVIDSIRAYNHSGHVESAEPDIRLRPAVTPNDPQFTSGEQWGLNNIGQFGGSPDADIDAPEAWERFNSASNIIVAVIDSGVRYTHEDLAANMWINPGEIPANGLDDDANGIIDDVHGINAIANAGNPFDDLGHGTHVAGIIGAVGNNGLGISGVAWRVKIMACKFLSPTEGSASDLIQSIDYARDHGAHVLNCSFTATIFVAALSNAFWSIREAGILVAAAAGNDGTDNDSRPIYPANFAMDNIVAVTATTRSDGFAGYNYGANTIHLGAPGIAIRSTYSGSDNHYHSENGTSMAAPHVAGALALMRSHYPQLSPPQILQRLLGSVDPIPSLVGRCTTGGRLNLNKAVGPRDYTVDAVPFAWVSTNGMSGVVLDNDGVSSGILLPFSFVLYGKTYSQVFVSAYGMVGFENAGLATFLDTDIPNDAFPNAVILPYWDDLNASAGGTIWVGATGIAPHRRFIVSWVAMPHSITSGGETRFTFQTILHETGEIAFQYLDVQNGRVTLVGGKSATIGLEDETGMVAARYSYHGVQGSVTNGQALLFAPRGGPILSPVLTLEQSGADHVRIRSFAQPGKSWILNSGSEIGSNHPALTNLVPASGVLEVIQPISGPSLFFRAQVAP
jgi:subtilisin family serine protease